MKFAHHNSGIQQLLDRAKEIKEHWPTLTVGMVNT